jgi:hypothetical protein
MDTVERVLVVLALLAYSGFRLIRYFRYGMSRRVTAVPPSTWGVLPATETPTVTPVTPVTRSARFLAGGVSFLVFATANAILWLTLFGLPALEHIPVIWRLFIGIFANFYLLPYARAAGRKQLKKMRASAVEGGGNPFGG